VNMVGYDFHLFVSLSSAAKNARDKTDRVGGK